MILDVLVILFKKILEFSIIKDKTKTLQDIEEGVIDDLLQ